MGCRGRASIAKRVVRSTHSLYVRRVSKSGMFEELEGGVVKRHFFVGGRYGMRETGAGRGTFVDLLLRLVVRLRDPSKTGHPDPRLVV